MHGKGVEAHSQEGRRTCADAVRSKPSEGNGAEVVGVASITSDVARRHESAPPGDGRVVIQTVKEEDMETTTRGRGASAAEDSAIPAIGRRERASVHDPGLRRAGEDGMEPEDSDSHLTLCAYCREDPPNGRAISVCEGCPRIFCSSCLLEGLQNEGLVLEEVDGGTRLLLTGSGGDFYIRECPWCARHSDLEVGPPTEGVAPMKHLLVELLKHDLSHWFRSPVDIDDHPDYLESIGRGNMMDLGTMMSKLDARKYPRRRGPGQYLEDLNRIWRNCRRFAGCDELGQPHYGTTVPGIVRCALILEAMSRKFYNVHISDKEGTEWPESAWDYYRQREQQANSEARLKALGRRDNGGENRTRAGGLAAATSGSTATMARGPRGSAERRVEDVLERDLPTRAPEYVTRKRTRATMEAAAGGGGEDVTRGYGRVLPRGVNHAADATKQSEWHLLDELCDVAAAFAK